MLNKRRETFPLLGYYYDTETGLYYLQARYYDPNTGRFLNADGNCGQTGDLLSANVFAYCKNNPAYERIRLFMIIAQSVIIAVVCMFLTTCLIIYRNRLSKWTITSIVFIQLGLILVTIDNILLNLGNRNTLEKIVWMFVWVTSIPGLAIILIEAYIKAIRYNTILKRFFLILMSIFLGGIVLFIFCIVMKSITG